LEIPVTPTRRATRAGVRWSLILPVALGLFLFLVALAVTRAPAAAAANPHGPYSLTTTQCATCHRTHLSAGRNLLKIDIPQSTLCYVCHDGTGSTMNIKGQYTATGVQLNNALTRSYYSHDVTSVTTHTLSLENEFGGVLNRHSECSDCHNPHKSTSGTSSQATVGTPWAPGGALLGVSGVMVTNGAAGTAPTYGFRDGDTTTMSTEYQLCLKCHSSFTTLLSNTGFGPSAYMLDKGVEFNPANASFHPVEGPGKNTTPKMALSLSGTSPYKKWTFTTGATVRCTNCHAGPMALSAVGTAGSRLPNHAAANRGILLANYRDRVLHTGNQAYAASDFALCYLCHTDSPFGLNGTKTATNFQFHGKHVSQIPGAGSSTNSNIDVLGAGSGNAICSECHFRTHSTALAYSGVQNAKLVNFSPNVQPVGNVVRWTSTGVGSGSCTLLCHGMTHNAEPYAP
jgi:predicted CXXCH cytochrome family protein